MYTVKFEDFIGKKLSEINSIMETDFKNDLSSIKTLYFAHFDSYKSYYGMNYDTLSIVIDENNIVTSLTIHFKNIIDANFFNSFNMNYDVPDKMYVIESKKNISESKTGYQHLSQGELKMKEATFSENPFLILWNKKKYQIKILNREGFLEASQLTFRLPTDQF